MKKNTKALFCLSISSLALVSVGASAIVISQTNVANNLDDKKQISSFKEISYDKETKKIKFSEQWEQPTYIAVASTVFALVLMTTFFTVSRSLRKIRENEYENVKTIELSINSIKKI